MATLIERITQLEKRESSREAEVARIRIQTACNHSSVSISLHDDGYIGEVVCSNCEKPVACNTGWDSKKQARKLFKRIVKK